MTIAGLGDILASSKQIGGDANEDAVARAYLVAHANDFERVDFNVKLGPGVDLGGGWPPYIQRMATANSQARADMIAYRGNTATVVEFKGNIRPGALGQVLTYWQLLRAQSPQLLQVYKVVAGQTVQFGLTEVFFRYDVLVELFPAAVPAGETQS
jgi:hypothetical protein